MKRMTNINENFGEIQRSMFVSPTTFIHGDIKSENCSYFFIQKLVFMLEFINIE